MFEGDGATQVHYNYKLILIGNSEVGKTSVSTRFLFETFEDQERSTNVKISHKPFKIPQTNKVADLHIWDTLGQEKFKAIANMFFKGTVGAFLVFDLSNQKSFDDLD